MCSSYIEQVWPPLVLCSGLPYLLEYNAQNFIPKTPTQSSVRVINEVLDFYAFTSEVTWVQVRILNKSYARERASTIYFVYPYFSITQGAKTRSCTRTARLNNLVKKRIFKSSLQDGSAPNFHFRCICDARRWVASVSGCAFLEFDESLHDAWPGCRMRPQFFSYTRASVKWDIAS